ncbi:MerR family transcriptional regulator [Hydrogenophaga sp. BPS33]|uniref:MerR family transcriptional regulator n=1 Tax=Hydrogenophaga sp. BPS33 TaxID=2651974 RepID=UPI00135B2C89|nr:MerR family transcriptional regulator [Hydrogenophaga sp. BPS33]
MLVDLCPLAAAGVSAKMVRHYEQIGPLPAAESSTSSYRLYGEREVSVLRFIRQSRRLDLSVAHIAELIGLWSDSQQPRGEGHCPASRDLRAKVVGNPWTGALHLRTLLGGDCCASNLNPPVVLFVHEHPIGDRVRQGSPSKRVSC